MRAILQATLALTMLSSVSSAGDLLVVAPRAFSEALGDFITFKKTRLPAELIILEDLLASSPGVDDAERLKRFLYEKWRAGKCAYVLLAGDADVLPVRYMVLDRVTPAAFDYSFYPSDLYYADLAKADGSFDDWNGQREGFHAGYFGEVRGEKNKGDAINFDGIDYLPSGSARRGRASGGMRRSSARTAGWIRAGISMRSRRCCAAAGRSSAGCSSTRRRISRIKPRSSICGIAARN